MGGQDASGEIPQFVIDHRDVSKQNRSHAAISDNYPIAERRAVLVRIRIYRSGADGTLLRVQVITERCTTFRAVGIPEANDLLVNVNAWPAGNEAGREGARTWAATRRDNIITQGIACADRQHSHRDLNGRTGC